MKKICCLLPLLFICCCTFSQVKNVELFTLIKKLVQDSTGYETVGDWAVGKPATYPVKWQADRIVMSDDEKINFYRTGVANLSIKGKSLTNLNKPMPWSVMIKGARSGFSSFTITSGIHKSIHPKMTLDSLFNAGNYEFKLLQSCDKNAVQGFYYYTLKMPKKVVAWIKVSYKCSNEGCSISLDGYDDWSKQYADVNCPYK